MMGLKGCTAVKKRKNRQKKKKTCTRTASEMWTKVLWLHKRYTLTDLCKYKILRIMNDRRELECIIESVSSKILTQSGVENIDEEFNIIFDDEPNDYLKDDKPKESSNVSNTDPV